MRQRPQTLQYFQRTKGVPTSLKIGGHDIGISAIAHPRECGIRFLMEAAPPRQKGTKTRMP